VGEIGRAKDGAVGDGVVAGTTNPQRVARPSLAMELLRESRWGGVVVDAKASAGVATAAATDPSVVVRPSRIELPSHTSTMPARDAASPRGNRLDIGRVLCAVGPARHSDRSPLPSPRQQNALASTTTPPPATPAAAPSHAVEQRCGLCGACDDAISDRAVL